MHPALRPGLETAGLNFGVPVASRVPQLNAMTIPDGMDESQVLRK